MISRVINIHFDIGNLTEPSSRLWRCNSCIRLIPDVSLNQIKKIISSTVHFILIIFIKNDFKMQILYVMRIFLFTILLFVSLYSCNRKRQTPLTEDEVISVIKQFDDGWEKKNMDAVDSALAPSYVYFTQSGGTFSRDSVVATSGESSYLLKDMSRSEFVINIYDNTAIVSTRWKGKGVYRGTAFNEDQRCSIVVVKKDNKVEILSEHCTPIKTGKIFH